MNKGHSQGHHSHERYVLILARGLGPQCPRLRNHPHHAIQQRTRGRNVERAALQALHHSGCALPDRLRPRADARRRQGADAGAPVQFAKSAEGAIVVERALHGSFFERYGITAQVFNDTPLSPACHHYVSYLLATAYAEPYEVLLGALLPCFWIYAEVGRDIHGRAAAANPYQAWIDTYAGEQFHAAVRATIEATDEAASDASPALLERMHRAFTRATQLEWMFWDSAHRLEPWPV